MPRPILGFLAMFGQATLATTEMVLQHPLGSGAAQVTHFVPGQNFDCSTWDQGPRISALVIDASFNHLDGTV